MTLEQPLFVRNTNIAVTDILKMIAEGLTYEQIVKREPRLNYGDIMAAADLARQLLDQYVGADSIIRIDGKIQLTARRGKWINLGQLRKEFPRAYEPWTREETEKLRSFHEARIDVEEIASRLGRQEGAIISRLEKLGLVSSYADVKREVRHKDDDKS